MYILTWRLYARSGLERVVHGNPVLVLYVPFEAHDFHPLRVVVDELAPGGGPLFPQTADVQVFVLHRQPLCFEPYRENSVQPTKS